jgi:hypothetical protein
MDRPTSDAPALVESRPLTAAPRHELSVADVVAQVEKIQLVVRAVMKEGVHYGIIPGTGDKPTLYKAGAEKLCLTFRLDPQYEVLPESVRRDDYILYVVRCVLYHIPTGERVASGFGSCNSREAKYRYRFVPTQERPPRAEADRLKAQRLGRWQKAGDAWVWHRRVDHDNPADLDNTLLKIASKRALVAAVLNGTAASDLFTQDVEDLADLPRGGPAPHRPAAAPPPVAGAAPAATLAQRARILDLYDALGLDADAQCEDLARLTGRRSTGLLTFEEAEGVLADLAARGAAARA